LLSLWAEQCFAIADRLVKSAGSLDADSFLLMDVEEDIFGRMARKKKTYGYMVVTQEDEAVVKVKRLSV